MHLERGSSLHDSEESLSSAVRSKVLQQGEKNEYQGGLKFNFAMIHKTIPPHKSAMIHPINAPEMSSGDYLKASASTSHTSHV